MSTNNAQPAGNSEPVVVQIPPPALEYFHPNRAVPAASYWREGMKLRAGDGAVLPPRCVKCNAAEGVVMKAKKFTWYPRWTLFLLLINLLVFAIVAVCLQKKATVTFGLCAKHRRRRAIALAVCLGLLAGAIGGFILAGVYSNGYLALAGVVMLIACIVDAAVAVSALQCTLVRDGAAWLKGAGADFLSSLDAQPATQVQQDVR